MEIPKDMVVSMVASQFGGEKAAQAAQDLPDQLDHEDHADLLNKLGIDPQEAVRNATGGSTDESDADQ